MYDVSWTELVAEEETPAGSKTVVQGHQILSVLKNTTLTHSGEKSLSVKQLRFFHPINQESCGLIVIVINHE